MTRKRFVKLLMAKWCDRNRANKIANLACNFPWLMSRLDDGMKKNIGIEEVENESSTIEF